MISGGGRHLSGGRYTESSRLSTLLVVSSRGRMTGRSDKPFIPALRDLMEEREFSFRKLVRETGRYREGGYSLAYLSKLATGRDRPTAENMAVIARAMGADPTYFREYREHVAAERARELARRVGLDEVLAALEPLDNGGAVGGGKRARQVTRGG